MIFAISGMLSVFWVFPCLAVDNVSLPAVVVESQKPLKLSILTKGRSYDLPPPAGFMNEIDGAYDSVSVEDLTGDGVREVIFRLSGAGGNYCSRVLYYDDSNFSLKEMNFQNGDLCNFRVQPGLIISAYKDSAAWVEDVYEIKNGKANIKVSDRCVGCGDVSRKEYRLDGSFVRFLVSDDADFTKRMPLEANVISPRARIFSSPESEMPTEKYLVRGDKVTLLSFDSMHDGDWVEVRFSGKKTVEGWLRRSDIDDCN